jgi:hypothetical protein
MKRITPFTLLCIAIGALLTVIALQQSDIFNSLSNILVGSCLPEFYWQQLFFRQIK